jgi:hypothetical protein
VGRRARSGRSAGHLPNHLFSRRYRYRHPRRQACPDLRGVHAGRWIDFETLRRYGARTRHCDVARSPDGRHPGDDKRAWARQHILGFAAVPARGARGTRARAGRQPRPAARSGRDDHGRLGRDDDGPATGHPARRGQPGEPAARVGDSVAPRAPSGSTVTRSTSC